MWKDDIINNMIKILNYYENKGELFSNQGQALDGYSALANFLDIAKEAKKFVEGER